MPVWGTSALPRDEAGQASPPHHSQRSAVSGTHWASPEPCADSQAAGWEESQASETMNPHGQRGRTRRGLGPAGCQLGQNHRVPQPLRCQCTNTPRRGSNACSRFNSTRALAQHFCIPAQLEITLKLWAIRISDELTESREVYLKTKQTRTKKTPLSWGDGGGGIWPNEQPTPTECPVPVNHRFVDDCPSSLLPAVTAIFIHRQRFPSHTLRQHSIAPLPQQHGRAANRTSVRQEQFTHTMQAFKN